MIIPNLMVTDMPHAIAFYRDVIGLGVTMMISADREILEPGDESRAVFVTLDADEGQLMLQTVESLAAELDVFQSGQMPHPGGTIYFRGMDPAPVANRATSDQILKGPFLQWYGMKEVYLRDPDGHIICIGQAEGKPEGQPETHD